MKNLNLLKLSFIFLLAVAMSATSCTKEEKEKNEHNDAWADVLVKKIMKPTPNGPVTKYGLVMYAGGEGVISCTMTAPNGTSYTMGDYWKGAGNLRFHTSSQDLKGTMPENGDYVFTLIFDDGETKELTDVLSAVEISPMTPPNINYDASTETIDASWNVIDGADQYMLKLTDKNKNNNKPIFVNKMPITKSSYTFDRSTQGKPGWQQTGVPAAGDEVYIFMVAVKFEDGAAAATKDQNRQMVTAFPKKFIW